MFLPLPLSLPFRPAVLVSQVTPNVLPSAAPSPPDIRGIIPAQPYFILPANLLWLALGLAVLLLLGAGLLWYFFWRPRPAQSPPGLSPREIAAARLRALEQQAGALDPKVFGVEVCDILRAYTGAQFGLDPERQTSPEFLASIMHASVFSTAQKTLLAEFLEQCDLLKFARLDATGETKRNLLAQAGEFLQAASPPPLAAALSAHP